MALTITHRNGRTDQVAMAADGDGRWVADGLRLRPGDTVQVAAGGVRDDGGNVNGQPSNAIVVSSGPPPNRGGGGRGAQCSVDASARSSTADAATAPNQTLASASGEPSRPVDVRLLVGVMALLALGGGSVIVRRRAGGSGPGGR